MKLGSLCLVLLLFAVLALAALPTLLYPLTRDQGAYAYIADLMMKGGVPYRDVWDLKPPAIYFVYWLAFALFGRSEFAVRLFDVLYTLLSAASVYLVACEVFESRRMASLAAWIYALCYYLLVHFYAVGNPESFMVPLLAVGVWGIVRGLRSGSRLCLVVSGLASGFAFWFKPTAGVVVVALLTWAGLKKWQQRCNLGQVLHGLGLFVAGGLLGLLPIGAYLYGNGLRELLQLWREYGTGAYLGARGLALGEGPLATLDVIVGFLRDWQPLVWLSTAGAVAVSLRPQGARHDETQPRRLGGEAVLVWMVSSIVAVLLQAKLFEYHWIPALAPAAILSAASLIWLGREWQGMASPRARDMASPGPRDADMRSIFVVVVIAGSLLSLGYENLARYRRLAAYLGGRMNAEQYYSEFNIGRDFSHAGTVGAAEYLREHTRPDETVLIWGAEPLVNFLAERRSPTKYIFSYMLFDEDGNPRQRARQEDFLSEAVRSPPAYVVLVENDVNPLTPLGSRVLLEGFPTFREWLASECYLEVQVEDYLLYRHD